MFRTDTIVKDRAEYKICV